MSCYLRLTQLFFFDAIKELILFVNPYIFRYIALTPEQLDSLTPTCMLPQNFSGNWFTSSQYDSTVTINSTHLMFNTLYTSFSSVCIYHHNCSVFKTIQIQR